MEDISKTLLDRLKPGYRAALDNNEAYGLYPATFEKILDALAKKNSWLDLTYGEGDMLAMAVDDFSAVSITDVSKFFD